MALKDRIATLRASATSLIHSNIRLERGCRVYSGAVLETNMNGAIQLGKSNFVHKGAILQTYGGRISTGDDCTFNSYVVVYGHGGVTIGNNVSIATHAVLVSFNHRFSLSDQHIQKQGIEALGIVIEDDVWIGAGATILDGVTIRTGSIVGAGAVVTRDTAEYSVYAGVPARCIRKR